MNTSTVRRQMGMSQQAPVAETIPTVHALGKQDTRAARFLARRARTVAMLLMLAACAAPTQVSVAARAGAPLPISRSL